MPREVCHQKGLWDLAPGSGCQKEKKAGPLCCQVFNRLKIPEIYQFLDVGSIKKENVQAKQNRSLGHIWLKGCHSAVSGLWDNNS